MCSLEETEGTFLIICHHYHCHVNRLCVFTAEIELLSYEQCVQTW